jgi:protein-tyrosine kinase
MKFNFQDFRAAAPDTRQAQPTQFANADVKLVDRSIGDLIRDVRELSDEQIDEILTYQRENSVRFGEAAVALKLASGDDVLRALALQFHYPYASEEGSGNPELVIAHSPFSDEAEAFRELRSQLMMDVLSNEHPHRALAVLSPSVGDGKTYLAANLAVAFSQLGGRTLLVDADMRTPRQQQVFEIDSATSGLSGILSGRAEHNVIQRVSGLPSLYLLPVGVIPPNPLELVQRPAFGLLMHELLSKFDHVVVDTPAAVHGADSRVIAAKCGAALVIGRTGKSKMDKLESLLKAVAKSPAKLAGVVMNEH